MASHEELIGELPKLDKLSNAARLKAAKRRRIKQLKKYQEWVRLERASSSGASFMKKRGPARVVLEDGAMLSDMVGRNDIIGGESAARLWCDGGGGGGGGREGQTRTQRSGCLNRYRRRCTLSQGQNGCGLLQLTFWLATTACRGWVRYSYSVATVHSLLEGGWSASRFAFSEALSPTVSSNTT